MVLADSSYPLLNLFWTMCILFLWVIWIWILIWVFIDIFRSHDLSGGAKALWFVFVLFIPVIGVLVYLIARGGSMSERAAGAGLSGRTRVPQLHSASLASQRQRQLTTSWQSSATRGYLRGGKEFSMGFRRRIRRRAIVGERGRSGGCSPCGQEAGDQQQDYDEAPSDDQAPADGGQDQAQYAPPPADPADEIEHLAQLHASGALSDEEFTAAKAKILGI